MGCFWGAEKIFWNIKHVHVTSVGYPGGSSKNPTYEEVCSGLSGHTEVVKIIYDPLKVNLETLLVYFWEGHDPTQGMRQGNDNGSQYRSAIYYTKAEHFLIIENTFQKFQKLLNDNNFGNITTEIKKNINYFMAEEYHQQYLYENPRGYCGLDGCGIKYS